MQLRLSVEAVVVSSPVSQGEVPSFQCPEWQYRRERRRRPRCNEAIQAHVGCLREQLRRPDRIRLQQQQTIEAAAAAEVGLQQIDRQNANEEIKARPLQ